MTLTAEQQAALDELVSYLPSRQPAPVVPASGADFLQTWLGISGGDFKSALQSLLQKKDGLERQVLDWVAHNPLDAAFEFLGLASYAFYLAEKDANPKIETFMDAFYYIGTCASVGYADIFAVTQTGRAIAALVMIVGPSMAAKTLDRPEGR